MMSNCICVVLFFLVGIARNSALVTNTNTNYKANYLRQHCSSFSTARRFSTNSLSLDRSRAVTIDTNTKTSITTQTIRSLTGRTTSKTKRLTTALASKYSPLDSNRNGRIDFKEVLDIPEEIIQSSQLLQNFMRSFKSFLSGKYLKNTTFLTIIQKLVNPIDLFLMTFIFYFHKRFLRWLYTITHRNNKKSYEDSFIGHLQGPITIFVSIPPILLATDFVNAILKYSGLQNLVKTDITKVAPPVCYAVFIGQVITNLKDYYFQLARERMKKPRDLGKEGLTDELTSTVIWLIVAAFCLENLSLEVGLGVGK